MYTHIHFVTGVYVTMLTSYAHTLSKVPYLILQPGSSTSDIDKSVVSGGSLYKHGCKCSYWSAICINAIFTFNYTTVII